MLGDIDIGTASRIERGLVEPRRETIVKLAKAFGMSALRMRALLADDVPPVAPAWKRAAG